MANSGLQILGFALALLGVIALIIGTILPQWKMSAYVGDNIITAIAMYEGLWMSCAFQSTGQIQCKVYDSILQLNSALQATRALMIVSIIVTVAGLGVACMGMKCTTCGGDDKNRKSRIAMIGGIIILIGALCGIVACSWYAHDIIQAFYNPFTPVNTKRGSDSIWRRSTSPDRGDLSNNTRTTPIQTVFVAQAHILPAVIDGFFMSKYICGYEFGAAIFIAWAGAFLTVVGGAMLAASCPRGKPTPKYPISRPPSSSKEYV